MIKRIWRGWATKENSASYRELLLETIIPEINSRGISGYHGIEVLLNEGDSEDEYVTIMTFDSLENIIGFVGDDIETAHVPDKAQAVLARWDKRVINCKEIADFPV